MSEWHPIPGWEKYYEITRTGRVRSLDRQVISTMGRTYLRPGKEINTLRPSGRYRFFIPHAQGVREKLYIHRILAEMFIPNPEKLPVVRHLNDNPLDNRLENLAWGTQNDNMQDRFNNRGHHNSEKTHCPQRHEYSEDNTYIEPGGGRVCKTCRSERLKKHFEKRQGTEPEKHGTLNSYKWHGCRCDLCKKANTDYCRESRIRRRERDRLTTMKEEKK